MREVLDLSDLQGEVPDNVIPFDPDQLQIEEKQVTCVICGRTMDECDVVTTEGESNYCIDCFVKHCM